MPKSLPLVQLQVIQPFVSALKSRGVDPENVLESVGLTLSAVEKPGGSVHVMVIHEFLESCAVATDDQCFCARVGASLDTTGWPMIQQAMSEATTLGSFLRIYVTKASQVASSVTAFMDVRGETATFGEVRRFKPLILPAQNDAFMVSLELSFLKYALGETLDPSKVSLVVSDPKALPEEMHNHQVLRGDDMGSKIQFPAEWLGTPLSGSHSQVQLSKQAFGLKTENFLSSFKALLQQNVGRGGIRAKDAATLVHMHPRKLARHLSAFDTTVSREIRSAKVEYAKRILITSDRTIESISLDLGYSDASNFSRAFTKETGEKPHEFRARSKTAIT